MLRAFVEKVTKTLGSIKCVEYLQYMRNYQLHKKGSATLNQLTMDYYPAIPRLQELSLPHTGYSKPSRIYHKYDIIYKTEAYCRIACIQLQVNVAGSSKLRSPETV